MGDFGFLIFAMALLMGILVLAIVYLIGKIEKLEGTLREFIDGEARIISYDKIRRH